MFHTKRIFISGSPTFNNYYLLDKYVNLYLRDKYMIILNAKYGNTEKMAATYANLKNIAYEDFSKSALSSDKLIPIMVKQCCFALVFDDLKSEYTKEVIKHLDRLNISYIRITTTDADMILPHKDIVVNKTSDKCDVDIESESSIFKNEFHKSKNPETLEEIWSYMDYFLDHPEIIKESFTLQGQKLGCYCSPNLCHGDTILWMLDNATSDMRERVSKYLNKNNKSSNQSEKPITDSASLSSKWNKKGGSDIVYTISNKLQISTGYMSVVSDRYKDYLEISEQQLTKANIWLPPSEKKKGYMPYTTYRTKDYYNIPLRYQEVDFSDCPFKIGRWYISLEYVTK